MAGFPSSIRCFALLTAIGDSLLPNTIDSTAGLPAVQGSESAAQDYRNMSTSAGLETRMSWTPSGVKPLYSILGAMWSSMYE